MIESEAVIRPRRSRNSNSSNLRFPPKADIQSGFSTFGLYHLFTISGASWSDRKREQEKGKRMAWLAVAMFVVLFGWGAQYFGWADPHGKVQLALFTAFILGVVSGYKNKG